MTSFSENTVNTGPTDDGVKQITIVGELVGGFIFCGLGLFVDGKIAKDDDKAMDVKIETRDKIVASIFYLIGFVAFLDGLYNLFSGQQPILMIFFR
jgi:hypothetical protein